MREQEEKRNKKSSSAGRREANVGHTNNAETDDSSTEFDVIRDVVLADSTDKQAKMEAYLHTTTNTNSSSSSSSSSNNNSTKADHQLRRIRKEQGGNPQLQKQSDNAKTDSIQSKSAINSSKLEASKSTNDHQQKHKKAGSFNIMSVVKGRACASHRSESGTGTGTDIEMSKWWIQQFDNSPVQEMPTQSAEPRPESQPGAYMAAPGTTMDRVDDIRFSMFARGAGRPVARPASASESNILATTIEDGITLAIREPQPTLPEDGSNSSHNSTNEELLEAIPVESQRSLSSMMEAQPMDQENLDQKEAKYKRWKRCGYCIVVTACVLLAVSLAIRLTRKQKAASVIEDETFPPTSSPTDRPLPSMENLEVLYAELPATTRESLYNNSSPQYQAWEWLLNHPSITAYPEWRKIQVFAIVTFYYSFTGPHWPKGRWLNASSSECSWVFSHDELLFYADESGKAIGPDTYGPEDYQPCNEDGELQTLLLHHLHLPANVTPSIPPEIELLQSLRIFGIFFSTITAKLSDLVIPELVQLPNLHLLNFHSSGVGGTIPKQIGLMTGLKHLLLGHNKLKGSLPVELTKITSLELGLFWKIPGLNGRLPTEIGLMTSLTHLEFGLCSLTGTFPSEVGVLPHLREINFWGNSLTGRIPTELGLLTTLTNLDIAENGLTGPAPSEIGLMTSIQRIWLNNNALTSSIPSELGLITNARILVLGNGVYDEGSYNDFSGQIPSQVWELPYLERLFLPNLPNLHGSIPAHMFMQNMSLLRLEGSPHLSGSLPDEVCSLQDMPASSVWSLSLTGPALDFDCSGWLCGCNCECRDGKAQNGTRFT